MKEELSTLQTLCEYLDSALYAHLRMRLHLSLFLPLSFFLLFKMQYMFVGVGEWYIYFVCVLSPPYDAHFLLLCSVVTRARSRARGWAVDVLLSLAVTRFQARICPGHYCSPVGGTIRCGINVDGNRGICWANARRNCELGARGWHAFNLQSPRLSGQTTQRPFFPSFLLLQYWLITVRPSCLWPRATPFSR